MSFYEKKKVEYIYGSLDCEEFGIKVVVGDDVVSVNGSKKISYK